MSGLYHVTKFRKSGRDRYRNDWSKTYKRDIQLLGLFCENCGSDKQVERHHILEKSRHKGIDAPINLKLLCKTCHKRHHMHTKPKRRTY